MGCEDYAPLWNQIWGGHENAPHNYADFLVDPKQVEDTDLIVDAGFTPDLVLASNNSEGGVGRHYD